MGLKIVLFINLVAFVAYGTAIAKMHSDEVEEGTKLVSPAELRDYGQLRFLTYQCGWIQLICAGLHITTHFKPSLKRTSDLMFTTLAYPVGSVVVLSFWFVWFAMGRELILPSKMDAFFPSWLNHTLHTMPVPVNLLMLYLIHHKFAKRGAMITLTYALLYILLLFAIKARSGRFVYPYLEQFSTTERTLYFIGTLLFSYIMYKTGQLYTCLVHGSGGEGGDKLDLEMGHELQRDARS